MKYILLVVSILSSCAKANNKPHNGFGSGIDGLKAKYAFMLEKARNEFDEETGWPSKDDCDGTLWAGLAYSAGADFVKIELAEYKDGEIHRRPAPSCWDDGDHGAQTTVSRDMLNGYMWAMWSKRDLDALKRLARYGEEHFWKMGKPFNDGRVMLTGNGIGLLGRMIKKLGGPDKIYRHVQPLFTKVSGFEFHLLLIGLMLNASVDEGLDKIYSDQVTVDVTNSQKDLLEWAASEQPNNATAQAAWATYNDGNFDKAIELLMLDDYPVPEYVSGSPNYKLVYWLFSAKLVLARFP